MPLKNVKNLGYVILLCQDLMVMRNFYRDVLGLTIADEETDWVEMRIGSTLLSLRPRGRWYDGDLFGDGASIQLSFEVSVEQVDAAFEQLKKNEVEICEPPTDQIFGQRTLYLKDPERNILEIFAYI